MKKVAYALGWMAAFVLVLLMAFTPFVGTKPPIPSDSTPRVFVQCLDPTLERFAVGWQIEAARRFPDAIIVLVHGGDFVQGEWIVEGNYSSGGHVQHVEAVIRQYQELFPGRPLILTACNPGHLTLHGFPNVYYAKSSVWCVPDRQLASFSPFENSTLDNLNFHFADPSTNRSQIEPDDVGNIFEFIEAN